MNLNKYQKIQVILAVLIIIAIIGLIRTFYRTKNLEKLSSVSTSASMTEISEDEFKPNTTPESEIIANSEGDVVIEDENDTSWDEEDVEDTKVEEEKEEEKKDKTEYYIKVNYSANCVTVYKKDDSGNYTIPVKALICSTGTATPRSGVYKTSQKYRWHQLNGGVFGQYCTRITGHILFHSVPCSSNTPDSLKYVAYDKLGTTASAGCVRLTVEGAMWIYNNCSSGTYVEFYASSNPGPLGKPSAKKISSNVECRNWDPTDPDPRNPWHSYVEKEEVQIEQKPVQAEEKRPSEEQNNNNVKPAPQEENQNNGNSSPVQEPVSETPSSETQNNTSETQNQVDEKNNNTSTENTNSQSNENKTTNNNTTSENVTTENTTTTQSDANNSTSNNTNTNNQI